VVRDFEPFTVSTAEMLVMGEIELHEYLDGYFNIFYQGKKLKHKPLSKEKIKSLQPVMVRQAHHKIEKKKDKLVTINY
jgi:hypothetical protein